MRALLALTAATAALALAACGDSSSVASVGDCTDADPTLNVPGVRPDVVDCDDAKAKSKIVGEADRPTDCRTEAYVKTEGDSVFCVQPLPGKTFRDQLDKASRKGRQAQENFQKQMDELKERLKSQPPPVSP